MSDPKLSNRQNAQDWSTGPGDYDSQRQLDYKLVDGILQKVAGGVDQPISGIQNGNSSWTGSRYSAPGRGIAAG